MKRQTAIWFYALGVYVVLQLAWWTYHLVDLTAEIHSQEAQRKQIIMITGEGLVFFLLLFLGLWKIRSSIQKEILISNRQNNFLLSITHELKTPLASNKLYLQTLLKRENLERQQQEQLIQHAIEENQRLEEMIDQILTATQIENRYLKLNLEECNLSDKIINISNKWSKNRVPVKFVVEENVHTKVDLFVVETVLNNLLENAYKYVKGDIQIEVYLRKEKNNIVWGVKDNGTGIPVEDRKDIFKKFVRIGNEETRSQKGTGLGLYIVKNLLLFHGDKILYLPNKPQGAHFKITRKI